MIIQTSPYHTASTLLVNAIYGLIPELFNKNIIGDWSFKGGDRNKLIDIWFKDVIVIKSHNPNIDDLIQKYSKEYNLFFICSERKDNNIVINEKYKQYSNVIIFDYNEFTETNDNTIIQTVDNIYNKLYPILSHLELDKQKCMERIQLMNQRYEEIKNKPFEFVDPFFELHGSHRNRTNLK